MAGIAIVALRFVLYLDLMLLFGLAAFGLHGLRGEERRSGAVFAFRPWLGGLALAGVLLSLVAFLAMVAGMAGIGIADLDAATVRMMLAAGPIGLAFQIRVAALGAALVAAIAPGPRPATRLAAVVASAGIALGSLAWTGHGAMDEGAAGWLHLAADIAHLFGAGIWIGALAALIALVVRDLGAGPAQALAGRALASFAGMGTAAVATLVLTGAINTVIMLRAVPALWPPGSWELLLALKLAAFAGMLGLAALNRFVLTPRLLRGDRDIRASLALEAGLGVLILLIVAKLGTLAP